MLFLLVGDLPPRHLHEFVITLHRLTLSLFKVFLSHVCDLPDLSLVYNTLIIFLVSCDVDSSSSRLPTVTVSSLLVVFRHCDCRGGDAPEEVFSQTRTMGTASLGTVDRPRSRASEASLSNDETEMTMIHRRAVSQPCTAVAATCTTHD